MENINLGELGKKKKSARGGSETIQDSKDQFRVVIAKDANASLEELARVINADLESATVTKSDIANYLFCNLSKFISDSDIKFLRAQHFDAKKALSAMLRSAEDLPEEVQRALRMACGISDLVKKRSSKGQTDLSTGASVDNPKMAEKIL